MTNQLINSDYRKGEDGAYLKSDTEDELYQNAVLTLHAERGKFYPDKNFGSRIKATPKTSVAEQFLAFAQQALDATDGVYAIKAEIESDTAVITLLVNDEERKVSLQLENNL